MLTLANYDMQDGSFDLTSVTFPSGMLYRSVTFEACVAGELDSGSKFTVYVYKKDCTEAAYINYVAPAAHKISMFPPVSLETTTGKTVIGDIANVFDHAKLGFSTSDSKCPIEIE